MSTRHVPSRPCDRCGDKYPWDELTRMEVQSKDFEGKWFTRVCPVCAYMVRLAFNMGFDVTDAEWWFRAP